MLALQPTNRDDDESRGSTGILRRCHCRPSLPLKQSVPRAPSRADRVAHFGLLSSCSICPFSGPPDRARSDQARRAAAENGGPMAEEDSRAEIVVDDPEPARQVLLISAGASHSVALLSGDVICSWGRGEDGQLGHGDAEDRLFPTILSALDSRGIVSVVCGADHTTAYSESDLQVYSWGWGDFGRLGHGNSSDVFTPQPIKALQGFQIRHIACGDSHCLAVTMDGEVQSWGRNQNGQLGLGTTEDSLVPQKIQAFQGIHVKMIAAGAEHTAAVTENGDLYGWGWGRYGNLGLGDRNDRMLPEKVASIEVERERGITVKAQTAAMFHRHVVDHLYASDAQMAPTYLLNLIDTPGHVDFSYEVSRSLAACQGALLVVDAAQGVQAQTVANFYLAFESNLSIIPVINKIDQPTADPERVKAQLKSLFDLDPKDALLTSAKTGQGLEQVLPSVIERIPPPPGKSDSPLRMLLLDSYYDEYKGVICHVAVVDGTLRKGDKIASAATGQSYEILDVGIMHPELTPTGMLFTGQVGYIVSGMRSTKEARVGDTLHHAKSTVTPLSGFKPAKHMVFSGLYPANGSDFDALNHAIERLTCNDASVLVTKESSTALGMGFRCGFLGLLHMDVFHQRLEQEYGAQIISTIPTVPYIFEFSDGSKIQVQNPAALPSNAAKRVTACWEPTVIATIIIPTEFVGPIITLCSERRGEQLEYSFIDSQRALMKYRLPLREIIVDFYDELKSITSGYASFDYEDSEYQKSDLVKLDILLNGQPVDAMATIVHNLKAQRIGRELVDKLKKFIDRHMFEITIQAAIGSKIIARETLSAMRKNVLAKCYGGDITRKKKLLEKQKEGKKRMKRVGSVDIPQEAFHELLKTS